MTLIAIDVLLDPDAATIAKAQATNARLREDYPDGFALDASHAPHITLLQRFVRAAELDEVANAVAAVLRSEQPVKWECDAIGYYDLPYKNRRSSMTYTAADPLRSWNAGPVKQAIVAFIARVTKEGSPEFLPLADRIAVYDNDGTLWPENPMPFQAAFAIDELNRCILTEPELASVPWCKLPWPETLPSSWRATISMA